MHSWYIIVLLLTQIRALHQKKKSALFPPFFLNGMLDAINLGTQKHISGILTHRMFLLCWTWVSQAVGDSWYTLLLQCQSQLVLLPAPSASGQEPSRTKIAGPGLADLQSWWMTMSPVEPKTQAREEFHYHTHTESFIKNELSVTILQ